MTKYPSLSGFFKEHLFVKVIEVVVVYLLFGRFSLQPPFFKYSPLLSASLPSSPPSPSSPLLSLLPLLPFLPCFPRCGWGGGSLEQSHHKSLHFRRSYQCHCLLHCLPSVCVGLCCVPGLPTMVPFCQASHPSLHSWREQCFNEDTAG